MTEAQLQPLSFVPQTQERVVELLTRVSGYQRFRTNASPTLWNPNYIDRVKEILQGQYIVQKVRLESPQSYVWCPVSIVRNARPNYNHSVAIGQFSIGINRVYNWVPTAAKFISQDHVPQRFEVKTRNQRIPLVFYATDYDTGNYLHYSVNLNHTNGKVEAYDSAKDRSGFTYYTQSLPDPYTIGYSESSNFVQQSEQGTEFINGLLALKHFPVGTGNDIAAVAPLTSNTEPAPFVASASSGIDAWHAFDTNPLTAWTSTALPSMVAPQWLVINLGSAKRVDHYQVACPSLEGSAQNWTLQGSNDGIKWTYVDYRVNQAPLFAVPYVCDKPDYYQYYRLLISSVNGVSATNVAITQLDLLFEDMIINYPVNQAYYVATTDQSNFVLSDVTSYQVAVTYTQPANTLIKCLVSFDGRQTWRYLHSGEWKTVPGATLENLLASNGMTVANMQTGINNTAFVGATSLDFAFSLRTSVATTTPTITKINISYTVEESWLPFTALGAPQGRYVKFQPPGLQDEGLWEWRVQATDGTLASGFYNIAPDAIDREPESLINDNVATHSFVTNNADPVWAPSQIERTPQISSNNQFSTQAMILRTATLIDNCESIADLTETLNAGNAAFSLNTNAAFYKSPAGSWLITYSTGTTTYVFAKAIASANWGSYSKVQCWIYSDKYGSSVDLYINGVAVNNAQTMQGAGWQEVLFDVSAVARTAVTSFGFGITLGSATVPLKTYFDSIYGIA